MRPRGYGYPEYGYQGNAPVRRSNGCLMLTLGIVFGMAICLLLGIMAVRAGYMKLVPPTDDTTSTGGPSLFTSNEWPEGVIGDALPEPDFDAKPSSVSTYGSDASISYKGISMDDAMAYVEQVRKRGFFYEVNETKSDSLYTYSAHNKVDVMTTASVSIMYQGNGKLSIDYNAPIQ